MPVNTFADKAPRLIAITGK